MNEWQAFAESTTDAAIVFDRAGTVVVANAAGARLFGSPTEPLRGALRDFPRIAPIIEPLLTDAFTFGEATRIGDSPFGDARTVSIVVRATVDRACVIVRHYVGDHPGDLAFLAREHRKMDRLLMLHVEHSPLAVIRWDESMRITSWSGRAEAIFGWSEAEVAGKSFDEFPFVYPDDSEHVARVSVELLHGRVPNNTSENRNFAKDGRVLYTRWVNSVVRVGDERTMLSLVEDVTAAHDAEVSAQESRERMGSLFNATPDIVLFTDADGTITAANRAAQAILGDHALVGRHVTEVVADDGVALVQSLLASVGDGATVSSTLPMRRGDGRTVATAAVSAPVRIGGRITGTFWTAHDMSDYMESAALIEASEQRFRSLFEHNPDPMFAVALDGVLTRVNAAATRSYHIDAEHMEGRPISEFIDPRDIPVALAAFNRATRGLAGSVELLSLRAHREPFPALLTVIPIVFRGEITGVHVHTRDMSIAKRAERDSTRQAARIRELYLSAAASNENAEEQIRATIEAGCRILGMSSGVLFDANTDAAVAAIGPEISLRLARLVLATDGALAIEDLHGLPWIGDVDEHGRSARALIAAPIDVAGQRFGSLCFADPQPVDEPFTEVDRDLVHLMGALVGSAIERSRARARLAQLAYHDQLTALPNRAWFGERLRAQLDTAERDGTRFAVMFLDLDRFKDINDTLGHDVGDRLLRVVGERLTAAVGANGRVARTGGDEFIVLMPDDPTPADVSALAERLVGAIDQPVDFDGYEQFVTTSIGISMYPGDGTDADSLVKHADIAMYRAKERGRNTFQFFTPALNATLRTRLSQEKSLRKALERGEFVVYYQPVHDLLTGALVAVEALVRWNHPRLGLVMPDQFIPSAELSGLIVPLGDWVTETACAQVREWQRIALPQLRVAVNLSGRQFHQQHLAAKICAAADRVGLDPRSLEIEITESVAMNDAALSVQILEQLGAAGIRLAVDDFGTGYSSLGYLRRFALDTIKIDRSFVADVMHEPDDATIVRTVIAMAHSLGLEVVAEGVETSDQLAFLRAESCDRVQGHLFLRAVSADDLTRYIASSAVAGAAPIGG